MAIRLLAASLDGRPRASYARDVPASMVINRMVSESEHFEMERCREMGCPAEAFQRFADMPVVRF